MAEITMPKMSDAMEEGTVVKWLKREGDQVSKGEPIAEVETEKATLEIESFETGVIKQLITQEGQTVPVGTPIAVVETDGKAQPAAPAPEAQAPAVEAPAPPEAAPVEVQEEERPAEPPAPPTPPAPPEAGPPPTPPTPPTTTPPVAEEGRVKASPLAQRMARDAGLDLGAITGTGPGGRIVEADVREYMEKQGAPAPAEVAPQAPPAAAPAAPAPVAAATAPAAREEEPGRIRRAVAKRMTQSKQTIPHFYVTSEIMMDETLKMRQSLNAVRPEDEKITVTDIIIKACAMALVAVPEINASWQDEKIQYHERANVAIAVALDEGLIAPVISECDVKSLSEISAKSKELIAKARAGEIRPEELSGGTFTVSNLGMYDVEEFTAIIVPPESAILAVASIAPRAVVVNDELRVAKTMKATISADHRVTDGVGAARFLQEVKKRLESPFTLVE